MTDPTAPTYLFLGSHPETLDSGRRVARGDSLTGDETEGPIAQRLAARGQIVETRDENKNERKARLALENGDPVEATAAADSDQGDDDSPDDPAAAAADTGKETI